MPQSLVQSSIQVFKLKPDSMLCVNVTNQTNSSFRFDMHMYASAFTTFPILFFAWLKSVERFAYAA